MSLRQVLFLLPESVKPAIFLLAGAIVLLKVGLWPRRTGHMPYCRRCGQNLTGVGSDVCPECGRPRSPQTTVLGQRHRNPWLIAGGLVLLALSSGLAYKPAHMFYYTTDFYQYKPSRLVLADMQSADLLLQTRAARELLRRLNGKALTHGQTDAFFRRLIHLKLRIGPGVSLYGSLPCQLEVRTPLLQGMYFRVVDARMTWDGQPLTETDMLRWKAGERFQFGFTSICESSVRADLSRFGRHTMRCELSVAICQGTDDDGTEPTVLSRQTVTAEASMEITPEQAEQIPRFVAILFCNNRKYGPKHGGTVDLGRSGKLTCGPAGAASLIAWQFIRHRDGKDVYSLERRFPLDGPVISTEAKQVEYAGTERVVFEDEDQVIVIKPGTVREQIAATRHPQ